MLGSGRVGKRAALIGITATVLSGAGLGIAGSASAATTLIVGDSSCAGATYTTIGAAEAAASNGDTIEVCAGTYNEDITTNKSLTFLGAQSGVDARGRSGAETIVNNATAAGLSGPGTVVDGFTFTGANDTPGPDGAAISLLADGSTVKNTIFSNDQRAVVVISDTATLTQNVVNGVFDGFFFCCDKGSNSTVSDNAFTGSLTDGAVNIAPGGPPAVTGVSIAGNTYDAAAGSNFVVAGVTSNLNVSNNTANGGGSAIVLLGGNNDYTVSGNRITGSTGSGISAADFGFTYGNNGGGSITRNDFEGNYRGIKFGTDTDTTAVEVHDNMFVDNTNGTATSSNPHAGIWSTGNSHPIHATDNWWGCNGGPGATGCDAAIKDSTTTGSVAYDPWLVLRTTVGTHTLNQGVSTSFHADLNHDSAGGTVPAGHEVLDGESVAFAFTKGTVGTASANLVAGAADTTITAGNSAGTGTASATVDHATSTQSVTVTAKPALSISDASTAEGNSGTHPMTFTVKLSHKSTSKVTVKFTTGNGTAKAGSDYVAKSGTLTIPAGHTSATISVQIKGDKVKEPNESFSVTLYSPTNATISDPVGSGVIRNDD